LPDRLADLVPSPRKHRHRYHGVFAPNHRLRSAVTTLAIGSAASPPFPLGEGRGEGEGNTGSLLQSPRSQDTSGISWAKFLARLGEHFPLECPACGADIRLIAFITEPAPIRTILTHLGEPPEPPPLAPARGPPADWRELVQVHDDRDVVEAAPDELPVIDIHAF